MTLPLDVRSRPTADIQNDLPRERRTRWVRRAFLTALALFVAAGAAGLWGVTHAEVAAEGGGYALSVRYPLVARGGLATSFEVTVTRPGGFSGPIVVAVSSEWLDLFDENGIDPEPATATADADRVIWEFDPPPGDTLVIALDARVEPGRRWRTTGTAEILADGNVAVRAEFRTWLLP